MATVATAGSSISISRAHNRRVETEAVISVHRSRKLTREAGHAIEMLGHAIEYLADEFALECMSAEHSNSTPNARVAAIELLKLCNREIYLSCPLIPTFSEVFVKKIRSLLHLQDA